MINENILEYNSAQITILKIGGVVLIAWLVVVIYWLNKMMDKYTYGVQAAGEKWENPYRDETLGLPPGTLRAILTLTIMIVVIVLVFVSGAYEEIITAFEIILAFYFGGRLVNNVSLNDKLKSESRYKAEEKKAIAEAEIEAAQVFHQQTVQNVNSEDDPFYKEGAVG